MKRLTVTICLTLVVLLGSMGTSWGGDSNYGDLTVIRLVRVYDGDTFFVDIDELHDLIGKSIKIRLRGVDTPEVGHRSKCEEEKILGNKARVFVEDRLTGAEIILLNIGRGTFFRILADVTYDGVDLATELLKAKLGRKYDGGKRSGWCDS
jgi:endonuclease YncB( thermonuclease family)